LGVVFRIKERKEKKDVRFTGDRIHVEKAQRRAWAQHPDLLILAYAGKEGRSGLRAGVIAVQAMPKRETPGKAAMRAPKAERWYSKYSGLPRVQGNDGWW